MQSQRQGLGNMGVFEGRLPEGNEDHGKQKGKEPNEHVVSDFLPQPGPTGALVQRLHHLKAGAAIPPAEPVGRRTTAPPPG